MSLLRTEKLIALYINILSFFVGWLKLKTLVANALNRTSPLYRCGPVAVDSALKQCSAVFVGWCQSGYEKE